MTSVKISSKYQVVIPKEARNQIHLKTGQKLMMVVKDKVIILIPNQSISSLRGLLKGIDITSTREK